MTGTDNAVLASLQKVQRDLKAPKNQRNTFGKYSYRSAEDILEAVKPHLDEQGLVLTLSDEPSLVGDRYYIKATATVKDVVTGGAVTVTAYAREPLQQKGMSESQVTGTASSYARKYALNGLFAIDDTKDTDTDEWRNESRNRSAAVDAQANEKKNLLHQLMEEAKRTGASSTEMTAIIKERFDKNNSKELTLNELKKLVENLESYLMEKAG